MNDLWTVKCPISIVLCVLYCTMYCTVQCELYCTANLVLYTLYCTLLCSALSYVNWTLSRQCNMHIQLSYSAYFCTVSQCIGIKTVYVALAYSKQHIKHCTEFNCKGSKILHTGNSKSLYVQTQNLMSCCTCHVSHVTCHVSHVTCHQHIVFCHETQKYSIVFCGERNLYSNRRFSYFYFFKEQLFW